tara:strand:- start:637 stop:1782 length:1146 start_codon:yes stop_codon:yes gene_type:complete
MSTESSVESKNLVSIICRTLGRPELQQALRSIASQDYPNIEIILVDAAGDNSLDSTAAGDRPLVLVNSGSRLSRSQAANAGLEAANGKYIQFLDDDDWIDSNHVSQLLSVLESNKETAAAYSSTQKTNAAGDSLDYVFREDFDPILLMRDNYIPIHAILFESVLLENGCRFDEAFDIYEDWDFWLQLSRYTNFQHIDSITAYYREGGDSETAVEDVRLRYKTDNILGRGRAAIYAKWLSKWTGEEVNALIGHLDQSVLIGEQDTRIHSELSKNAELQYKIEKQDMQINALDLQLAAHREQHTQLSQHANELEQRLNTIYSSTNWKLMGPVRRVSRAFAKVKNSSNKNPQNEGQAREKLRLDNLAKAKLKKFLGSANLLQFP